MGRFQTKEKRHHRSVHSLSLAAVSSIKLKQKQNTRGSYTFMDMYTHTHMRGSSTHKQAANSFSTLPDKLLDGCCYCVKLHTHRQTHRRAEFNCAASRKCHISGRVRRFFLLRRQEQIRKWTSDGKEVTTQQQMRDDRSSLFLMSYVIFYFGSKIKIDTSKSPYL